MDKLAPPISHKTILKYSGIIGFVLPLVLVFGTIMAFPNCTAILDSISTYYHTDLGDYFVASLAAISFCFYAYDGYSNTDKILSKIAALALLGVAFLPTYVSDINNTCIESNARNEMIGKLHYACAAIVFSILAFFCLFQFPKGDKPFNPKKIKINILFKVCGTLIILCMLFIVLYSFFLKAKYPNLENYTPVFWCEAISLWAFSISWFVKGEIKFD